MIISQVRVFGELAVLAKSPLFGDNLTNTKTKPFQSVLMTNTQFIEFTIQPVERLIGTGIKQSLTKVMEKSCSLDCRWVAKSIRKEKYQGMKGGCNQTQACKSRQEKINKLVNADKVLSIDTDKIDIQSRLTAFGDLSRLNNEGLDYIYQVCKSSTLLLAYVAGWRDSRLTRFNQFFNASCSLLEDALEAYFNHGFLPYGLSREDNIKFSILTGVKPYKCPYDPSSVRGCSSCPVRCNGTKAISLKEKRA